MSCHQVQRNHDVAFKRVEPLKWLTTARIHTKIKSNMEHKWKSTSETSQNKSINMKNSKNGNNLKWG